MKAFRTWWRKRQERRARLDQIAELERCLKVIDPLLLRMQSTRPPTIAAVVNRLELEEAVIEGRATLAYLRTRV